VEFITFAFLVVYLNLSKTRTDTTFRPDLQISRIMAADHPELKGLSKYFNGVTKQGRANVAFATYGALFGIIGIVKLKNYLKKE